MNANHSKPVRALATVLLVPKAIAQLPKAAAKSVKGFADNVKDEIELREMAVRASERTDIN